MHLRANLNNTLLMPVKGFPSLKLWPKVNILYVFRLIRHLLRLLDIDEKTDQRSEDY